MTVDEIDRYEFKSEIKNNTDSQKQQYNYKVDMTFPDTPTIVLHGVLKKNERRVEFQANLANLFQQPVVFNVNYNHNSRINKYELIAGLTSHMLQLNLRSSSERKNPGHYSWLTKNTLSYKLGNSQQQTAAFSIKINDESTNNLKSFETEGSLEFSEFPHLNAETFLDLEYSTTTLRSKVEFKQNDVRKFLIAQSGVLDIYGPRQRINGKLQVDVPCKQWDWQAEYDHVYTDSFLHSNTSFVDHGRKEFFVNVGVKNNPRGFMNVEGNVEIGLPKGYAFTITGTTKESVGPTYIFELDGRFVTPRFTKSGKVEGVYKLVDGSRHEWNIKSQIEGFKPIEVSGHVNPNPHHMQLRGVTVYDGETYGMAGKYLFRGNSYERYNAELAAEVFYPGAKHTLEVGVNRRSKEFSCYITVLLKENMAYKFSTSFIGVSITPNFSAKVEWPNNFFEVSLFGKYESSGWMTTTGDLQGQVALRSSIPGIEELSSAFHVYFDNQMTKCTTSITWSPTQKIVADMFLDGMKLKINATTPFEGFTTVKFNIQSDLQGNTFNHLWELAWENDFVSITLEGNADSLPNFEGKLVINTGFRGFEPITLHVKNLASGSNFQSTAELTISRNQKIALTLISNNQITQDALSFEGRLAVQTFFRNLENQYITWNHKHNSTGVSSRYEMQVYGERYQLIMDGNTRLVDRNRVVSGDLQLKTPRPGFTNFGINLNYKQSIDAVIGEGRLTGNLEHERITMQHNLQFLPGEALVFKLSINTPFREYERMGLDLNNRLDEGRFHAANEIDLANVGKFTLGGYFKSGSPSEGNLELTTSYAFLERFSVFFKTENVDNIRTKKYELDYNSGLVLISGEFIEDRANKERKFKLDINTPYEQFRTFKLVSIANGTLKHMKLSADIEHNELQGKTSSSFTYDVRDPKKLLLLQYTLNTPFRHTKTFKTELKYHFQRQHNKIIAHAFYEVNRVRTGLSHQVTYSSWQDFSTLTEFTGDHKTIRLTTALNYNENSHKINATLTTPIEHVERVAFKFDRTGPWNSFSSDVSFEFNEQKVSTKTDFNLSEDGHVKISHNFDVDENRKATIEFQHNPTSFAYGDGWTNEGFLEVNDIRYTGYSELSWPERKEIVVKAFVNVPSEYGFNFHHKGDISDLDTKLDFKIVDETISNHLIFKHPDSETIELKFTIHGTYKYFENSEFTFDHQGSLQKFVTTATSKGFYNFDFLAQYDESEYKAKSELKITTYIKGLSLIRLTLDHVGPWNNFNTELTTQFVDRFYKKFLNFRYDETSVFLKASLQPPHNNNEDFVFQLSADTTPIGFKSNIFILAPMIGHERISLDTEYKVDSPQTMEFQLTFDIPSINVLTKLYVSFDQLNILVQTPIRGYERFLYKSTRTMWSERQMENVRLEWELETPFNGYEKTRCVSTVVMDRQGMMVTITRRLETSNPQLGFIEEYYHHNLDQSNIIIVCTMTSGMPELSRLHFSTNVTRGIDNLDIAAILQTPFPIIREIKFDLNIFGARGQFKVSCDCNYGLYIDTLIVDGNNGVLVSNEFASNKDYDNKRYFVKFQHSNEGENHFNTNFQISTPFEKLTELLMQLKYRGGASNLESGITIDYTSDYRPFRISSDLVLGLVSVVDHRILLKFDSPFPILKQFSLGYGIDLTREEHLATFEVKINDEKKFDFDYKRIQGSDNLVTLTLRSPYQMDSSLNMDGNTGTVDVDWDTTRPDSNVRFEFNLKNEETSSHTERSLNLRVITSEATAGFGIDYKLDSSSFGHSLRLQWTENLEAPDFSYTISGSSRPSGMDTRDIQGSVTITTQDINHSLGFGFINPARNHFLTNLFSQDHLNERRIELKSDLTGSYEGVKHVISFEHPDIPEAIRYTIEEKPLQNSMSWSHSLEFGGSVFLLNAAIVSTNDHNSNEMQSVIRFSEASSNTDVQLKTSLKFTDVGFPNALFSQLSYKMSHTMEVKEFSLGANYDVIRHEFVLKLNTPIKSTELRTTAHEVDIDNGVLFYEVALTSEDLFQVKSVLNFNLPNRELDLKLFSNQYNYYQVEGKLKGIREALVSLNKFENSLENAASVGWSVDDRNFLVVKNFVKPNFWEQWKVQAGQNFDQFIQRTRRVSMEWDLLRQDFEADALSKANAFRRIAQPYAEVVDNLNMAVSSAYFRYTEEFQRFYRENAYYVRDIVDGFRLVAAGFRRSLEMTALVLKRLNEKLASAMRVLGEELSGFMMEVADQLKVLEPHINRLMFKLYSGLREFDARLSALLHEILSLPEVREFLDNLSRLPALTEAEIKEAFWAAADSILSNRFVKLTIDSIANCMEKYKTIYSLIYSSDRVTDIVNGLRALTTEHYSRDKLNQAFEHFFKVSQNRWTVWDPETGNFEYQLFVPPKAQEWIDFVLGIEFQGIYGAMGKYLNTLMDEFRDFTALIEEFYSYDVEKLSEFVPPFKSTASITGAQHFRTFDGKVFQFASECSHLLSRDFVNKTFSAFVNYDGRLRRGQIVKKSLTIFTDGRKFDVLPDGRVMVDDVRTELPFQHLNTQVLRIGENEVQLRSERGFKLICDIVHDHCSFTVSGWYHGKVAGLFGNKNFEKADDLLTSDGVQVADVTRFASSWASQCESDNKAVISNHPINSIPYQTCFSNFNSTDSTFSSCFRHVDPTDFFHMCLNEVPRSEAQAQVLEGSCRISAAYQRECREHGVHVRMPKSCLVCTAFENKYLEGDVFRVNVGADSKSADVVFVIQAGACNKRVFDRIRSLTDNLQKAFIESEEIQFTRFALVSYGGQQVVPRLHTMDGRVFNAFDKIPRANFDSESGSDKLIDGMAAIQFAAKLPFRTGASKTIIFIPCHACIGTSGLVYPEVHRMIMQSDIKFHALLPDVIRVKSSSSHTKSAFIFGFDDEKVYTKRDVNSELEGDGSLRTFIRMPKDFCAALTHDTSGIVFSSRQWFDTPNQVQKSFVDVFARLIARKAQPTPCQECTCLSDSVGSGFTQCVSCLRRNYFTWINDFLDDDFEEFSEESGGSAEVHTRPVRPDTFTRGPQRQHTARPHGRQNNQQASPGRPQRPTRAPRPSRA